MSEHVIITVPEERTIEMVTVEIKTLQKQAQQVILGYAIEIGRRLTEAKAMLPHGAWGGWLRDEVSYSKSTANNFMRIFEEYGNSQMSLFGPEAKSQTLGNLPYTKALRLLAIPEDEREEFVIANNVEDISTRELDRLIKERDDARAETTEALERAAAATEKAEAAITAQETLQQYFESQRKELAEKLAEAQKEAEAKAAAADAARANAAKAQEAATKAQTALKSEKDKVKQLKENPVISDEVMERIRTEARAEADKAAAQELADKVKDAEEKREAAERAARNAQEDLERARLEQANLEKKLALANEDTILFKAEFSRFQEVFNRCHGMLMKIEVNNPDIAPNLKNAMKAVLDSMKGRV